MTDEKNEENLLKGPFWLICETDNDDNIIYETFLSCPVSLSQITPCHKDVWELCRGNIKKPWNYYPRGRVEIKRGKAVVYANSRCFEYSGIREQIRIAFNLGNVPLDFKVDNSAHYTEGVFGKYSHKPTEKRNRG